MKRTVLIILLVIVGLMESRAQSMLTRGPYLQFPTSSSMKVMWRTDVPTPGRVYYGTSLATVMDNQVDVTDSTEDHTVNITGLDAYTEYYYAVSDGSDIIAGPNERHRFRTSPTIGTVQPIRVWAIGDFGKGNDKQIAVKNSFLDHVGDDLPDFWMWLGDNVYDNGTDEEYSTKVFDSIYGYSEIFPRIPFMPTPGNHDYGAVLDLVTGANPPDHDGPYYDLVDVPTNGEIGGVPSNYELYYSFDYGNVHFMSLNSEVGSVTPLQPTWDWTGANPIYSFSGSPFTDWMEADLAANDKPWVVAFIHQPPYTDGSHESTAFYEVYMQAVRENLVPILEAHGVDLLVTGHSHVYERSYLLNGYYSNDLADFDPNVHIVDPSSGRLSEGTPYRKYVDGPNPNFGTLYLVQGNSGSSESSAGLGHPAMVAGHACDTCVGSTMLYINGDTLSGYYLTKDGDILDDWAIVKTHYTGIEEEESAIGNVVVSPNPFEQQTTFSFEAKHTVKIQVDLTDMTGKIIHTIYSGSLNSGRHTYTIDAESLGLSAGIYLIRMTSDRHPIIERIIKVE